MAFVPWGVMTRLGRVLFFLAPAVLAAEPLSRRVDIDFFRDVPSRNLKGLATRSDGRLVAGPVLTDLAGTAPADIFWSLEPGAPGRWLAGSGPDGRIFEVEITGGNTGYQTREVVKLEDSHVLALKPLPDGAILAGSAPRGMIHLVRGGQVVARVALPVDSIFDLVLLDATTALVATGNPGRVYQVDLAAFAQGGMGTEKLTETAALAARGIRLFGEVRDRNVRRIVRMADGSIAAGSAPRGNVYLFPAAGGAPGILQENRDAEVTDLLPQPNGDLYASIVFAGSLGETRINRGRTTAGTPPPAGAEPPVELPAGADRFAGRSTVVWFPSGGFPETLVTRANLAFYRLARRQDILLIAGGESGDILGYDLQARSSLTYAGSIASQLNALAPANNGDRYLLVRNNAPGFALLDFAAQGPREAETRRLDLTVPSTLGALRFNRLRSLAEGGLSVAMKTNLGSDDVEGWSEWLPLRAADGGWQGEPAKARYVRLRIQAPAGTDAAMEIDRASLYHLPQNRRPALSDFRVVTPNFALIQASASPAPTVVSLSQLVNRSASDSEDSRRRNAFMSSQVVPQPGMQLMLWNVSDPDGDNLSYKFSVRRDGEAAWTDLLVSGQDAFVQFDTSNLPEGLYFTRLTATEEAPRPAAERLSTTFETDDLVIDRTKPELLAASAQRAGNNLRITVRGRDERSLIDGTEFVFNNGIRESLQHPSDGILDSREESFVLEIPLSKVGDATSVEVQLYDARGNSTSRRVSW